MNYGFLSWFQPFIKLFQIDIYLLINTTMQKKQFSNQTLLFIFISLIPLLFTNCMKDKLEDGADFQHFNFYAFREPINDPADNIQKTNFFFEGGDLELWTDSFTITIDGEKMERNFHGFYQFKKNGRYNDGDIVKVKINHSTWGNLEFDYLFPDKPDTAYFRPELA